MDRDAAQPVAALGDGHPLAELGGLDRGALAAGAGADDQQVELHRGRDRTRFRPPRSSASVAVLVVGLGTDHVEAAVELHVDLAAVGAW